jgi:uncharacterized protein (TIGR03067 family)
MRTALPTSLLLFLAMTARSGEPNPDHKALQGSWKMLEAISEGKPLPKEMIKGAVLTFKGDRVQVTFLGDTATGTFKLDPTKKPRTIDLVIGRDRRVGIYAIEGNKLKLCMVPEGKDKDGKVLDRPTSFQSTEENRRELLILERMK